VVQESNVPGVPQAEQAPLFKKYPGTQDVLNGIVHDDAPVEHRTHVP